MIGATLPVVGVVVDVEVVPVVPAVVVVVVDVVVAGTEVPLTVSFADAATPLQVIVKIVDASGATDCDQSADLLPDQAE
jgi:hypothetical protein